MERILELEKQAEIIVPWKLASLYQAVSTTAVDPVVLKTGIPDSRFSRIYYDAHEDEEFAGKEMKNRIENSSADIKSHLDIHLICQSYFHTMQRLFFDNERKGVSALFYPIREQIKMHNELVKNHQEKLGEKAFLSYASTIPGHTFYRKHNQGVLPKLTWNPSSTYDESLEELEKLEVEIKEFAKGNENIADIVLSHIPSQDILKENNSTNLLLLERIGFKY